MVEFYGWVMELKLERDRKLNICTYISKKFDCVIASEVLEHIVDYKTALVNLTKMADKYIIITVPSCPLFQTDKNVGHIRHFDKDGPTELKEIFTKFCRQALHAELLGFKHPFSGEFYEFVSEIPKDFEFLLTQIKKFKSNH